MMTKSKSRITEIKFTEFPEEFYSFKVGNQEVVIPVLNEEDAQSQAAAKSLAIEIHKMLRASRDGEE